ncbi:type IV secretion system DNA-binding domain-containing protein [Rickettsiales endosymbiont of Peranema trichophorum]|uniref:type IV secretion system DNA-binding domain-containing protein n=1 Tax=Rickettsiales endosymbiont of Peranema trichophorum TaxID=2486577 RepID=UPI0013EE5254|nr:type IV secretion system DNA-binding domain-containing protein [Rickettsiales endosymbiont of Peranema trichophorum]
MSNIMAELQSTWCNYSGKHDKIILLGDRRATIILRQKYQSIHKLSGKDIAKLSTVPMVNRPYKAWQIKKYKLTSKEIEDVRAILIKSMFQALVPSVLTVSLIFLFVAYSGYKTTNSQFLRGRVVVTQDKLNKLIQGLNKKEKVYDPYSVAGVPYPPGGETEHLMLCGTTGTGKTVILKDLIRQIKERGDKALIYDYTGAFISGYYEPDKDIIINPFDKRSKAWCLLKETEHEAEFETIAEALIGTNDAVNDPFWPNGARLIFSELCKLQIRNGNFSTQDLYNHLLLPTGTLHDVLERTLVKNFTDPAAEKTTLGLLMLMTTYLKGLQYIKNDGSNDFSIKRWLLDPEARNIVFLSSRASLHNSIQPLISGMMDIAVNNLGELPLGNKKKIWLIFDEIASLNYLPSLERGLTVSRNFGGCFVISLQSISQLTKRYGPNDTETIASNCSNKIILKTGNNETAKWASQVLGTQEIEEYKEGLSYGAHRMRDGVNLSKNRIERRIALPSEMISLPRFTGYAAMTGGLPIALINFEHLKTQKCIFENPEYCPTTQKDGEEPSASQTSTTSTQQGISSQV